MSLTNAQLSADVAALIARVDDWQKLYSDWSGGAATGGPNADGRYPLKNSQGNVVLVYCPAALETNIVGPGEVAKAGAIAAEMARDAAQAATTLAASHKEFAQTARTAAQAARDLTKIYRDQVEGMHANVLTHSGQVIANAAATSADRILVGQMAANAANSASEAASSAASSANSAAHAATFNPDLFDKKSDALQATRLQGLIPLSNIPVLPSMKQIVSSGSLSELTSQQLGEIGQGTVVTISDGRRLAYLGSGSKTSDASYHVVADTTPAWNQIDGVPSQFPPVPHGHDWADIFNKPLAFAPSTHGHDWSEVSGKPSTFAPSVHTHVWADITNKPLTFAPSAHGHDWSEITGKPSTFTASAHTHVWADINDKPTIFASNIASVSGLQSALDGKASNTSPTLFGHTRIEGPAGSDRIITMATGSKSRWSMMAQAGPENGSNSGSDFWLTNYNDDGSYKGSALEIRRSDNRALFLGGIQAATLTLNTGLVYPNGNDTVLRTGAAGGERYYAFGGDGVFRSLNGGMAASGLVHSNGFVSHSTPTGVYQRFKDNGTANGKALLQYKDTENFYIMLTNQGDADGGFNGLRPFVLNLTSGNISMNHGLTISGDAINVNGGNNANSTLIRRGSLEIRDDNYGPYVDFSTDGTTDFHARVSVPKSDGRLWLSHGAGGSVIVGPTIEANSNNGSQAGSVITHAGSEQIMAKQLTFPSIQNPQDAAANALLEVRGAGGGYGAWMKFHRPGAYGTYFGMFEDGEFGYGGWSAGGMIRKFWTEKNFDPLSRMERYCDGWVSTRDGNERFYFATNGRTYMRSRNGFEWRDNGDVWQAILTNDGVFETKNTISTLGNNIKIRGGSPTIYFKDTDNRSAMIHVNANKFYVLRGAGNDSEAWTSTGSGWPLEIDLENNNASFGANIYTGTDHWFRVRGTSGIYWENWGGGWFMNDSSWLRAYNDKNIVTGGQVQMGSFTVTSDRRLKTDITPIPLDEASRIIDQTNVYEFTKGGRRMFGMIAQEVQEVAPILVSEGADLHEDGDALLSLDQTGYIPLLLAEVRSLRQRLAVLEAKIK
ncbi:tail fiber domain-containing protein [Brevundimonas nasdae]|uniref:Shufflon system plasmid conjugative transfer pilus tip adhesin PilV n=1 Tax=Brevundimonas nasdae TaxID=172043 RepID=A0ACD4VKK6_9CAUL|nr:tail fiber domain-containing protein [Brevundimonas nasdae]WOB78467.1 shufflon system plasmid conjugative transfer pilus tip adhesin PilV [Brevundimonas nasdae]